VSPQNQDDLLFQNAALPNGSPQTFTVTVDSQYVGIVVVLESQAQNDVQVVCANTGVMGVQQQQAQIIGGSTAPSTFLFPLVNFIGDTVKITVTATASLLNGKIAIFGARSIPGVQQRPDGRAYPQNSNLANSAFGAGGTTSLVPAPAAPSRIMIGSMMLAALGGTPNLVATVEGNTVVILIAVGPGALNVTFPTGLLLDPATPLTYNGAAAGASNTSCTYDLVV
jgi:hypothetical protein